MGIRVPATIDAMCETCERTAGEATCSRADYLVLLKKEGWWVTNGEKAICPQCLKLHEIIDRIMERETEGNPSGIAKSVIADILQQQKNPNPPEMSVTTFDIDAIAKKTKEAKQKG